MPPDPTQWLVDFGVPKDKIPPDGDPDKGGSAGAPKTQGMKFSFDVPLPSKKVKVWGGRIEMELAIKPHISGTGAIDDTNKTKLTSIGTKAVFNWQDKTASKVLSSGNIFSDLKLARQGTSLVATSSTSTAIGKFDLKITFLSLDKKLQKDASLKLGLKVGEVEGALEPAKLKLPDQEIDGLKLSDLELSVAGSISIAPQWLTIIEKWAAEAGKDYLKSAVEDAGVVVGGDVVIAGSIVVGGVGTIAVAVYSIVEGWAIGDLAQDYTPSVAATKAGFKTAMTGGSAPSDRFGKAGHTVGRKNYDLLFAQTKKSNPNASDDDIKKAIAAKADDALSQVAGALDEKVRVGLWDGYLAKHKGSFPPLLSSQAKAAYEACFGGFPSESSSGEWKKYLDQHPTSSNF
ncbi:MAG: hypothetical protein ACLQU1_36455 [Bryobacteraceae bacterium]